MNKIQSVITGTGSYIPENIISGEHFLKHTFFDAGVKIDKENKEIIQKPLINYSLTNERRIELEFYVEHTVDLKLTHRVLHTAISKIKYLYPGKSIEIYFNDFKFTTIKISVWFWIDNHQPPGYMVARHDAIFNIISGLQDENISLAAPISLDNMAVANK